MIDCRLILVTDRKILRGSPLEDAVATACRAGLRAVQLREKDLDARSLYELAIHLREVTSASDAALLVNDRVDVALAARADGVQCPERGWPPPLARRLVGDSALIGASTHSLEGARKAEAAGADFVVFGPVFDTPSKRAFGEPQGLDGLGRVAQAVRIPVYAIGGITPARAASCTGRGARGVAVVSAILGASDVAAAVGDFGEAMGGL